MRILPGVDLVELPLPFLLGSVNVYFVETDGGHILIDCGMDTAECFGALDHARAELGIAWTGITDLVLTHMHPDHMGLAPRVLTLSGAKLWMHGQDAELLALLTDAEAGRDWGAEAMVHAGVPRDLIGRVELAFAGVRRSFRKLSPDIILRGGELVPTRNGDLEVLWTPGHSPGHVCLYRKSSRTLFSGDHLLENISPNIGWLPDADPLEDYLVSLQAVAELDVDLILPSHGEPFSGHREWIARAAAHHDERCSAIAALLQGGPATPHQLTLQMWTRKLNPFDYRFALFEVMAHLEYLARRNRIRRLSDGSYWPL